MQHQIVPLFHPHFSPLRAVDGAVLFFGGVLAALGAQLLFQLGIVELLDALLNVEHPVQVAVDDLAADSHWNQKPNTSISSRPSGMHRITSPRTGW